MIHAITPFALDRNYGAECNRAMARIPDGDWACIMDHDMALTTREWYAQIAEAIAFKPEAGAFTAVTNRIAAEWQRAQETDKHNHDMAYHRRIGEARLQRRTLLDITDTMGFGGVLFVISKHAWLTVGGFVDGLLCVDHQMHFALARAGYRNYLMENLYVYHWRRAYGDDLPADTPRAANCPCRRKEPAPTVRLALPERTAA